MIPRNDPRTIAPAHEVHPSILAYVVNVTRNIALRDARDMSEATEALEAFVDSTAVY